MMKRQLSIPGRIWWDWDSWWSTKRSSLFSRLVFAKFWITYLWKKIRCTASLSCPTELPPTTHPFRSEESSWGVFYNFVDFLVLDKQKLAEVSLFPVVATTHVGGITVVKSVSVTFQIWSDFQNVFGEKSVHQRKPASEGWTIIKSLTIFMAGVLNQNTILLIVITHSLITTWSKQNIVGKQ